MEVSDGPRVVVRDAIMRGRLAVTGSTARVELKGVKVFGLGQPSAPSGRRLAKGGGDSPSAFAITLSGGTVTLEDAEIADTLEGAINITRGSLALTRCTLRDNHADAGAALSVSGGRVNIRDSILHNNHANSSTTGGGAVYVSAAADVSMTNTTFQDNSARNGGGAVYVDGSGSNTDFYAGPPGMFTSDTNVKLDKCLVLRNVAKKGGGIFTSKAHFTIGNSTVEANTASTLGAGLYVLAYTEIQNTHIIGNAATQKGGGLYAGGCPMTDISYISLSNGPEERVCAFLSDGTLLTGNSAGGSGATFECAADDGQTMSEGIVAYSRPGVPGHYVEDSTPAPFSVYLGGEVVAGEIPPLW